MRSRFQQLEHALRKLLATVRHNGSRPNVHIVQSAAEVLTGKVLRDLCISKVLEARREQISSQHIVLCSKNCNP